MSGLAKCMTITDSWWHEGQRNVLFRPGFVVVLVVATKDQINKQMDKQTDRPTNRSTYCSRRNKRQFDGQPVNAQSVHILLWHIVA